MEAYRSTRAEMREAAASATSPYAALGKGPMQRQQGGPREPENEPPFDDWKQEAFEALVTASRTGEPFLLMPCTVNGEPTAAIVHVSHQDERNRVHVTPLFVAMTPGMVLIDQKGRRAGQEDERG
jgi:hypothetical protein